MKPLDYYLILVIITMFVVSRKNKLSGASVTIFFTSIGLLIYRLWGWIMDAEKTLEEKKKE